VKAPLIFFRLHVHNRAQNPQAAHSPRAPRPPHLEPEGRCGEIRRAAAAAAVCFDVIALMSGVMDAIDFDITVKRAAPPSPRALTQPIFDIPVTGLREARRAAAAVTAPCALTQAGWPNQAWMATMACTNTHGPAAAGAASPAWRDSDANGSCGIQRLQHG
jgi:hypothetical protein